MRYSINSNHGSVYYTTLFMPSARLEKVYEYYNGKQVAMVKPCLVVSETIITPFLLSYIIKLSRLYYIYFKKAIFYGVYIKEIDWVSPNTNYFENCIFYNSVFKNFDTLYNEDYTYFIRSIFTYDPYCDKIGTDYLRFFKSIIIGKIYGKNIVKSLLVFIDDDDNNVIIITNVTKSILKLYDVIDDYHLSIENVERLFIIDKNYCFSSYYEPYSKSVIYNNIKNINRDNLKNPSITSSSEGNIFVSC